MHTELTAFVGYIALAAGHSRGRSYTNSPVHSCFPPAIVSLSPIRHRCHSSFNLLLPRHVGYFVITSYSVITYSLLVRVAGRIVSSAYVTAANLLPHASAVRAFTEGVLTSLFILFTGNKSLHRAGPVAGKACVNAVAFSAMTNRCAMINNGD